MPSVADLGESKYLKQTDCDPAIVVTIDGYDRQNVAKDSEPPDNKYILKFKECKPLVLNKTNGNLIEAILGSGDFDDWTGKQVELYQDKLISFGGKITGGIRVRQAGGQAPVQNQAVEDVPWED